MISPDDLAARFAPPVTRGPLYARQLQFADAAYQLAEQALDALPRGHHLDQAVIALESAAHWVCAGLAAAATDAAPDEPVTYVLAQPAAAPGPTPAAAGTSPGPGPGPGVNLSLYRAGLTGALGLFPLSRLVAYVLAERADDQGRIADSQQPRVDDLCLATGGDSTGVLHAIEELSDCGWITRHTDGGPTRYQLRLPAPAPASETR